MVGRFRVKTVSYPPGMKREALQVWLHRTIDVYIFQQWYYSDGKK